MKKFLLLLFVVLAVVAACNSEEIKQSPAASFATEFPFMEDGNAILKIAVLNPFPTDTVVFPVRFAGDAVMGEDYTVSAEELVYGGDSTRTSITIVPLKYGTGKKVAASLELPEGWLAGKYVVSEFELSDKLACLSFERDSLFLVDSIVVGLALSDADGRPVYLVNGDEIAVSVNTEKSTAIEGEDFRFADSKTVVIGPERRSGTITLKRIGETIAEGRDRIVLSILPGDRYELGQFPETEIAIVDSLSSQSLP